MKRVNKTKNNLARLWQSIDTALSELNIAEEMIHAMKLDEKSDTIQTSLERFDVFHLVAIKNELEEMIEKKDPDYFRTQPEQPIRKRNIVEMLQYCGTKVISAFPATGKTTFAKEMTEQGLKVVDLDSSLYKDFDVYLEDIKKLTESHDFVLISTHEQIRERLRESEVKYAIVYPRNTRMNKEEYIKRITERDGNGKLAKIIEKNWEVFIDSLDRDFNAQNVYEIDDQYLSEL